MCGHTSQSSWGEGWSGTVEWGTWEDEGEGVVGKRQRKRLPLPGRYSISFPISGPGFSVSWTGPMCPHSLY